MARGNAKIRALLERDDVRVGVSHVRAAPDRANVYVSSASGRSARVTVRLATDGGLVVGRYGASGAETVCRPANADSIPSRVTDGENPHEVSHLSGLHGLLLAVVLDLAAAVPWVDEVVFVPEHPNQEEIFFKDFVRMFAGGGSKPRIVR